MEVKSLIALDHEIYRMHVLESNKSIVSTREEPHFTKMYCARFRQSYYYNEWMHAVTSPVPTCLFVVSHY